MAFLRLANIGKIYVSDGNVAVGIRGVNLSFEKGEFVAITGSSGSGKSTLLNVLSGMDTYEEGELFIEEQPTSHYLQPDWEEYREKYISFIFQDYNIIDSFTVLQNVELALMTIPDPAKRRKRAIELIERVGLSKHLKHKGSQLSGGQKQRTVIARALAKDSPIILADEPTGNLDSETSKEIIELLREISHDKLLIMVTHSFDQVENVATRHIRVFDGAIESDRVLRVENEAETAEVNGNTVEEGEKASKEEETKEINRKLADVSNGVLLGRSMFFAKPKLSIFLCFLMIVGIFGIFASTAVCGDFAEIFHTYRLFRKEEGRLIISHKDGTPMKVQELEELAKEYNAKDMLYYDLLLDIPIDTDFRLPYDQLDYHNEDYGSYFCDYDKDYGTPDIGRYPEDTTEILLRLPVFYEPLFGEDKIKIDRFEFYGDFFKIVGIKYYADTSEKPTMLFTREGFKYATSLFISYDSLYFGDFYGGEAREKLKYWVGGKYESPKYYFVVKPNRDIDPDAVIFDNLEFQKDLQESGRMELTVTLVTEYQYKRKIEYSLGNPRKMFYALKEYKLEDITFTDKILTVHESSKIPLLIGTNVLQEFVDKAMDGMYSQGTLIFDSNRQASKVAKKLEETNYSAVTTDASYKPGYQAILQVVARGLVLLIAWVIMVFFIAFFINLCSNRTISAFREDMTIMRSMGIPVRVIRIGIYVRMFLAQLPAYVLLPIVAYNVYHTPKWNAQLLYLQPIHYVLIYLGMIILMTRVTRKQIRNLFGASVKTSLRGGEDV
ncbi:MAG: ABC transporter ATP-binding protein [Lachnospiraceae bacterium]|nr:ABC transporter ATP-binding protein [Lachnospiraceae bacterium]